MSKLINKIIIWKLTILAGLIPLFFLPFTSEFYEFNKNVLLFFFVLVLLILWAIKIILSKEVKFKKSVFDLPILAVAGAFILSTIIAAPNKWETLWLPNGTGTVIALTIIYFIITNNIKKTEQIKLLGALIFGGVVLSLITIYQFIGLGESLIAPDSLWAFLRSKAWTPVGGLLPLATFLIVILALVTAQFLTHFKRRFFSLPTIYYLLSIILILVGLVISLYQLFNPASRPLLLPFSTAWAIAVESFKNGKIFLFGVGPKSFLDAFSQFRPLSYNLTSFWAIRFGSSNNFYLHSLTTVGLLGLTSYLWLIGKVIKKRGPLAYFIPLLAILLIFLFFPANFLILFVFYVLLALLATNLPTQEYSEQSRILPWTIFIPTLLLAACCFFFIGRVYAAEIYFKHSLNNIAQNDGTNAYNHQSKAISLNPFYDVYRISYSQTNLLLADALARKSDLSDQDRQDITTLIQQSISEAKTAVSLNKNKVINWENLANIYRQLINFAEGADQWTIATYQKTINLDPINPQIKLNLGGVYYALGNYDEAIRWFQQAVDNKVNFANGYYNLSAAYKEKGDFKKAHEMMQITLSLLPTDSVDYNKARTELDDLAKKIPAKEATQAAEVKPQPEERPEAPLIEPQPYPSPVIKPPIELPEEQATPEISPAPEATP